MLETLLTILSWHQECGEIMLDDDGDICLDWFDPMLSLTISKDGKISWASINPSKHGNDLEEFKIILEGRK